MQKQKIVEYLKQLGFSDLEAKIYATLLEVGPLGVSELADLVGVKRTRTYLHIDSLVEKGLLTKIVRSSRKQVFVNHPKDNLWQLVDEKIKSTEKVKADFPNILKVINASTEMVQAIHGIAVRYFKGKNGVKKIYEEALQTKEVRIYAKVGEQDKLFPDNVDLFNTAFKTNKSLQVKEILYDSPLVKEQAPNILSRQGRYRYKLMPKELKLTSEDILIYDNKVAILNYKNDESGIVLENADYYSNSKALFDYIWKTIPDQKL